RGADVCLSDINEAMLRVGRDRLLERGLVLPLAVADAEQLPFRASGFDAVSIAFGLRNCTDKDRVLAEAFRVLRLGGRFFCLEFSRPAVAALEPLYDAYSFRVLPWLGARVAGDRDSYQYLAESIRTFPPQGALAAMLARAGFARVLVRNLSGGIVAIHSGWKCA
ncbi:MAG: ubiquinone/menaquinone biosynthesis methyltransferase, partial [Acetobacteraceae bacterium]|nr:ubiquinone/menaquinone biosynthesis methyltransferase [Acetobacteraceae bacterium]